jgi:hypothetical protein
MAGNLIAVLSEDDGEIWNYPSCYTAGAMRAISVDPLLQPGPSRICLYEFSDINWMEVTATNRDVLVPSYAAISHVWKPSPAVAARKCIRPLFVKLGENKSHEISWHGLMQVATAAKHLHCRYVWFDFICINQTSMTDKRLQIKNMANIYAFNSATIIMFGGVREAQSMEEGSEWITRAWTLQEAVESTRRGLPYERYCLFDYSFKHSGKTRTPGIFPIVTVNIIKLQNDLAIVLLRELLSVPCEHRSVIEFFEGSSQYLKVKCFGDIMSQSLHILAPEALRSLMTPKGQQILERREVSPKLRGFLEHDEIEYEREMWRALWPRTSTKQHDMLFSSMNLFREGQGSIPVDYQRSFEDTLLDMIDRLHREWESPRWLCIGHNIPVYPFSGLLPMPPTFKPHETPTYTLDGQKKAVIELVCQFECCQALRLALKVKGASRMEGHLVCAPAMWLIKSAPPLHHLTSYTQRKALHLSFWPNTTMPDATFGGEREIIGKELAGLHSETCHDQSTCISEIEFVSSSDSSSDPVTIGCEFDGSLGPLLLIAGVAQESRRTIFYFINHTTASNLQRVGTGILDLPEHHSPIPYRHVRVGGGPGAKVEMCDCHGKERWQRPIQPSSQLRRFENLIG